MDVIVLIAFLVIAAQLPSKSNSASLFGYKCNEGKCIKLKIQENNFKSAVCLSVCRIFCGDSIGTLWPKPTGLVTFEHSMVHVCLKRIQFKFPNEQSKFWAANEKRFHKLMQMKIPNSKFVKQGGMALRIYISTDDNASGDVDSKFTLQSDESYKLKISLIDGEVNSTIMAKTCFGARHGLETLSQLIVFDDIRHEIQMLASADIVDKPKYAWRGILLDTARNFYSVKSIMRTLDGMAMVKMNTFHWHVTDSQSFPLELKSQPELFNIGAYSQQKIYTQEDIARIVEYGRVRGIRILPEFDAPAHVGEGWQYKNMTVCFRAQPWKNYCVEPPCGQLDPTVNELYNVLEDIYREMFVLFNPDIFHMGGDEVSINCWNSSESIQNWMLAQGWELEEKDFVHLWGYFQKNALHRIDSITRNKQPVILWTSKLTDAPYIDEYLDTDRYIIQIWTSSSDPKIEEILKRGYRIVLSNLDALYFDCGGAGWVTGGNNWCSPYIGWQKVYENNLQKIAGNYSTLVLGAEAAVWSEQIDEFTLDSRLWPRASALAERLWSNPHEGWRQAESRILLHRERLIENGIGAEALQPEWCLQNEMECPLDV